MIKGEIVKFLASDDLLINGLYLENNSDTCVIHIHGLFSSMISSVGENILNVCYNLGIRGILVNTRGSGVVTGFKRKIGTEYERIMGGTSYEIFEESLFDIKGTIDFLKEKGYKKFILCGHSTGCQKTTYYCLKSKIKDIIGLILLAPADDLNIAKELELKEKFESTLKRAKENQENKILFENDNFMLLSAKRFYDLYKEDSIEGNLFNYKKELEHISKVEIPILSIFGSEEEYAVISVEEMLEKISKYYVNDKSKTKILSGDHGFTGFEKELEKEVLSWIHNILE